MIIFNDPKRIPEDYGIRIAIGVTAFFLLMKFAGFFHVVELRMLNIFILVGGIYLALKKFKDTHGHHINYFRALVVGVVTGASRLRPVCNLFCSSMFISTQIL
jgi:hypothetical protein